MTDTDQLACSPEYQMLREQYDMLVAAYTTLISQYQDMTDHEAPHLSALYMHYFGKLLVYLDEVGRLVTIDVSL